MRKYTFKLIAMKFEKIIKITAHNEFEAIGYIYKKYGTTATGKPIMLKIIKLYEEETNK